MTNRPVTCATCCWWRPIGDEQDPEGPLGRCHGGVPQPLTNGQTVGRVCWPQTLATDACPGWTPPPVTQATTPPAASP